MSELVLAYGECDVDWLGWFKDVIVEPDERVSKL